MDRVGVHKAEEKKVCLSSQLDCPYLPQGVASERQPHNQINLLPPESDRAHSVHALSKTHYLYIILSNDLIMMF